MVNQKVDLVHAFHWVLTIRFGITAYSNLLLCIVYVQPSTVSRPVRDFETPPPSPSLMPTIKGSNENQVVTRRRKSVDVEGDDDSQVPSER
jgi:hypothetical protein